MILRECVARWFCGSVWPDDFVGVCGQMILWECVARWFCGSVWPDDFVGGCGQMILWVGVARWFCGVPYQPTSSATHFIWHEFHKTLPSMEKTYWYWCTMRKKDLTGHNVNGLKANIYWLFYSPKWLRLLLAEIMMKNKKEKFTSPPKNRAEKKKTNIKSTKWNPVLIIHIPNIDQQ